MLEGRHKDTQTNSADLILQTKNVQHKHKSEQPEQKKLGKGLSLLSLSKSFTNGHSHPAASKPQSFAFICYFFVKVRLRARLPKYHHHDEQRDMQPTGTALRTKPEKNQSKVQGLTGLTSLPWSASPNGLALSSTSCTPCLRVCHMHVHQPSTLFSFF